MSAQNESGAVSAYLYAAALKFIPENGPERSGVKARVRVDLDCPKEGASSCDIHLVSVKRQEEIVWILQR